MEIPNADEVRKNMKKIGGYALPSGGRYGAYSDGKVLVAIHEDDDEIVSIFDRVKGKFVYMSKNTMRGWKLFGEMVKRSGL